MIEIYKNTKIYIVCPSQVATGGPELLHQLAFKMNEKGYDVYMLYFDDLTINKSKTLSRFTRHKQPVHDFYLEYNTKYIKIQDFEDKSENLLIIPETYSGLVYMFKNVRKALWWLSVDNFFLKQREKKYKLKRALFLIESFKFNKKPTIYHLAQSHYAINFLKSKGVPETNISYLSDFLNRTFLNGMDKLELKSSSRDDVILYNPKKGYEITSKLKELLPNHKWVPIINMTPSEVKNLLLCSKVYIDFGMHPGKDRFPREAAVCGCCVITGLKGSSSFFNDINIPDIYKFKDPIQNIESFDERIKACFNNYDIVINDFEEYRNKIMIEEKMFGEDILKVFLQI